MFQGEHHDQPPVELLLPILLVDPKQRTTLLFAAHVVEGFCFLSNIKLPFEPKFRVHAVRDLTICLRFDFAIRRVRVLSKGGEYCTLRAQR